jgi:catechol 2,3-dioxygenase-like lactoylglutathione lyase family enzyme
MLERAIPVLHVADSTASETFYCKHLGFHPEFAYRIDDTKPDPCYMGLIRDSVSLHISSFSGDAVPGGVVYLRVDDLDSLHAEFVANGVAIALEPTEQSWGNREMYIKDPDGNTLRFIQEPRSPNERKATHSM